MGRCCGNEASSARTVRAKKFRVCKFLLSSIASLIMTTDTPRMGSCHEGVLLLLGRRQKNVAKAGETSGETQLLNLVITTKLGNCQEERE